MDINSYYPSNYLKAADVKAQPMLVTIASIAPEEIAQGESKPVLKFAGVAQGLVLNKTNGMLLAAFYGSETDAWTNQQIELYSEPVPFQGRIVDSIRVRKPSAPAQPVAAQPAPETAPVEAKPATEPTNTVAGLESMDEASNW